MSRITIKNILSPKGKAYTFLCTMQQELDASFYIEDNAKKILFGLPTTPVAFSEAIVSENEIIGWIRGDAKAPLFSSLLNMIIQMESEKKKLGSEVLMLYQEVNQIFNFSEKLAETIGQSQIAETTLLEAGSLIKADHGLIVLGDEETNRVEILASFGQSVFDEEKITSDSGLFFSMAQSGQSEIIGDLKALKVAGLIAPEVQSLVYASLRVKHRVLGAIFLGATNSIHYSAADLKFLITLALQSSSAIESAFLYEKNIQEAKAKEEAMRRIYEVANKFVPHEFIKSLGRDVITDIQLGDKVEKIVTVLFADIRDYTALAEQMTPEENFSFVCTFNERMGPIIREHHGFVNQYLGDGIMAIFPGTAADSLSAAIDMQKTVQELNTGLIGMNKRPIRIGIGMHTGPLIMGITGDRERMDAATISDTVNTASRLESLTKLYKVNILLSEASMNNLAGTRVFHFRQLGLIQLKGKLEPIRIYECFDGTDEQEAYKKLTALPYYTDGLFDYYNGSFKEAFDKFSRVLEIYPEDTATNMFLGKARQFIAAGIPDDWTGVEEMQNK